MDMAAKSNPAVETCIPPPHVFERTLFRPQRVISEVADKPRPSVKKEPAGHRAGVEKCEGAPGSLATLASDRGPSHPRSTPHGSRLPAISRGELQVDIYNRSGVASRIQKEKPRRRFSEKAPARALRLGE